MMLKKNRSRNSQDFAEQLCLAKHNLNTDAPHAYLSFELSGDPGVIKFEGA